MSRRIPVIAALLALGCGDGPAGPVAVPLQNNLSFVRAAGTSISFGGDTWVWCGPWEPGVVATPAVHVLVGGPQNGWMLSGVVADITVGQPNTFPNTFIWDEPQGVDLFILDPPNELSSQTDESSGRVTFQALDCSPGGAVRFTIDAVVGSEFGNGPSVRVTGSFQAPVGAAPGQPGP
jgi:hypothetical protein